jgi:O-succinylbenzoic acid--CoA ligase
VTPRLEVAAGIGPGDLVAVTLPPGPAWLELVPEIWAAEAAVLPLDHRLPSLEAASLVRHARPTVRIAGREGESAAVRLDDGAPVEHGVALVVHTSGTGGEPKLARFDRSAVEAAVEASTRALGARPSDRWVCYLPVAHIAGMLVLLRGMLTGAPVTVRPRFAPASIAGDPEGAYVSLVPTMVHRALGSDADLSRYRAILVGGSPLSPDLRARAEGAGARVIETYGLTESCGGVVYDGRPLDGVEVRVDEGGGIELRGPTLMRGYLHDDEATERAFTGDGWLRTGDAGMIGPDGRLLVTGRLDELIVSGGEKVWPSEVEGVLLEHHKVAEARIDGVPDAEWGERVVAQVVPRDPSDPPTLDELRSLAASRLARHKAPRELVLVERLPRTSSGKLRRAP